MTKTYQELMAEANAKAREAENLFNLAEEAKSREVKKDKTMTSWLDYHFQSSSSLTEEFAEFAKQYKSYLKNQIKDNFELVSFNRGHFYLSGFIKEKITNQFVYFSTDDVRYTPNGWYNNLLIRTAKSDKDYTGGSNCYTTLPELSARALKLIK